MVDEARLWPDYLLQVSPSYPRTTTIADLCDYGKLHPETGHIFRNAQGESFHLYKHQVEALELAKQQLSYVVTSGTGSGKSLTYFLPIIDDLLSRPGGDQVAALVVLPNSKLSKRP